MLKSQLKLKIKKIDQKKKTEYVIISCGLDFIFKQIKEKKEL